MKREEFQSWKVGPRIDADRTRVLLKPFVPGDEARIKAILSRVSTIADGEARQLLDGVRAEFGGRHRNIESAFAKRFEQIKHLLPAGLKPTPAQRLLIGSYFSCEYSLQAAALFNPSVVPHPDQQGVPSGSLRFIMSLRATGEGHISSIEFRSGLVDGQGNVTIDQPERFVTLPHVEADPSYERAVFESMLQHDGYLNASTTTILRPLPRKFKRSQLMFQIARFRKTNKRMSAKQTRSLEHAEALAELNYSISFSEDQPLSERAIFPVSSFERNGIEDARFVRFVDEDGRVTFHATYTAYNGREIMPLLLDTTDFLKFKIRSLTGDAAQNKGMALFPRKVRGRYAMISRHDAESLYFVTSDHLHLWKGPGSLLKPTFPWEFTQIGNCGSPIETDDGWLLLTHGVGPMRKYCIGAVLLDKENPSRTIRRLHSPLVSPDATEREGYVPNVVYTCGALIHDGRLLLPYAMSDHATRIVTVSIDEVMQKME